MNQILFTENKMENSTKVGKIVKVFCAIIIVFSICLIGKGIYGIVQNDDEQVAKKVVEPTYDIYASGTSAKINVKHNTIISEIYYSWNNGEEMQIKDVGAKNRIETEVQLPNEDAVLKVRIVDKNKNEFNVSKEFKYDKNTDLEKPEITMPSKITMAQGINVVVTDNVEISYVTYSWDDGEEVKVENEGEDKAKMEVQINLQEGKKKLVVKAVDHNGNESTKQKDIVVVKPPEITLKRSKGELIIKVTDEVEVTKVVYEINGTQYTKENTGENKQEFEIRELLSKGENIVKVTAYNKDGVTTEKKGKCTY